MYRKNRERKADSGVRGKIEELEEYLSLKYSNPLILQNKMEFLNKLYTGDIDSINRWQAFKAWNHDKELFNRKLMGEDRWMKIHLIIDLAIESL